MQVLLDGLPLSVARPSLANAIQTAAADAQKRGRIIVEVKADGVVLSSDELGQPSDDPSTYSEVRLLSADPRELVRQTVLDAVEALESVRTEQANAMAQVQTGDVGGALQTLQGAFVTWQAARDVVARGAALLGIDLETVKLPGIDEDVTFQSATTSLMSHLSGLKEALNEQDWSALSDIVGFDLDADATTWHALLKAFAAYIKGMTPGAEVR